MGLDLYLEILFLPSPLHASPHPLSPLPLPHDDDDYISHVYDRDFYAHDVCGHVYDHDVCGHV